MRPAQWPFTIKARGCERAARLSGPERQVFEAKIKRLLQETQQEILPVPAP